MTEKQTVPKKHETVATSDETLDKLLTERTEALRDAHERHVRELHEQQHDVTEVHAEASKLAGDAEKRRQAELPASPAERRRGAFSKKQLEKNYKEQLAHVQSELSASDKAVSKFIHIPVVEKAADTLGSTIARPNALLSGSIAAFVLVTAFYFIAKYYGYQLSGFETIAAFVFGWVIGMLYDYVSVMIRGHRR